MRLAVLLAGLAALTACEAIVGIKDKTVAGGGADPSAPCAQQPPYLFCDDFDQTQDVEAGSTWQWDTPKGGSAIELTTVQVKTPPRAVQIVSPPTQAASAQLGQPVGSLSTGFRLAFDLFVDQPDVGSIAEVAIAQVLAQGAALSINYVLGPGAQCQLFVYDTSSQATVIAQSLAAPPLRAWTRVVLVYDAAQGVSVLEDGASLFASASTARGAPGDTTLIVGAVYVNGTGTESLQVDVDDVVMRGQ
ncbi:MAG TPA: hypothetical protein VIF09_20085 [Polyangiaceae bacterium]|jgi:hypothetical protein